MADMECRAGRGEGNGRASKARDRGANVSGCGDRGFPSSLGKGLWTIGAFWYILGELFLQTEVI